jgi:Rps23 Pro-64 3,4-dihydroxylase Tpa1-like proline 4-hydroxylase
MIETYSDFFDEKLFSAIQSSFRVESRVYQSTEEWNKNCDTQFMSVPIQCTRLLETNARLANEISDYVKSELCIEQKVEPVLYSYNPGSGIAWHDDSHLHATLTCYINDEWDKSNGGLFLYEDNGIRGICPKRNLAVYQTEATPHAVSRLTDNSPNRLVLHCFVYK